MLSKKHIRFFHIAKELSMINRFLRTNIGCIVVIKNRIVSSGYNKSKTHPIQKRYNHYQDYKFQDSEMDITNGGIETVTNFVHAEIDALLPIKDMDLSHASIYIYRQDKTNHLAICRPCPACMKMITDLNIKHLFYTSPEGLMHEQLH